MNKKHSIRRRIKIIVPNSIKRYRRRTKRWIKENRSTCKRIFTALCAVVLFIGIFAMVGELRTQSYSQYFDTDDIIYINTAVSDEPQPSEIKYKDGEIYLPFDFVKENIDSNIYRSEEGDRIIITTDNNVIRLRSDDNNAYMNGTALELNMPVYDINNKYGYLPASSLQKFYPIRLTYNKDSNTVTMENTDTVSFSSILKMSTYLKYKPARGSLRVRRLQRYEILHFLKLGDSDGYTLVTTEDGLCGYVPTYLLDSIKTVPPSVSKPSKKQLWKCTDGKANIVFDQLTNSTANTNTERMPLYDGVDVICTTWFSFEDTNGKIRNIADKNYVDLAHAKGKKVWGLITDNFDGAVSHSILSNADTRESVIKQLLAYSSLYELDGINIDFESVPQEDGELFVQFIRELAPALHNEGITLSADFYVPTQWTAHYNRGKCAEVLDYVIVMGYDQHTSGSSEVGSNAEIGWSVKAIRDTLAEDVPKEKLILGIPFYTRVWTIANNTGSFTQKAMGMKASRDFMTEKGGIIAPDEKSGQNYAETSDLSNTYKCWFEDAYSIKNRLDAVNKYDIAGTAAWKSGFETSDIWGILKDELKGKA